jgi:hypothetical protein
MAGRSPTRGRGPRARSPVPTRLPALKTQRRHSDDGVGPPGWLAVHPARPPPDTAEQPARQDPTMSATMANYGRNSLTIYARNADGNVAPIGSIEGPSTRLVNPYGLSF